MFTLDQCRIFVCVCETGSFSAAARKLKKAQSGVSQAIANLEIDVGRELFIREKGGAIPTEAANILLPVAENILRQTKQFEQKAEALGKNEELSYSIALEEGLLGGGLANVLADFFKDFPHLELDVVIASTFDIERLVQEGRVQLGIMYYDETLPKTADVLPLGSYRFISVAHPDHPLASLKNINAETMMQHRHLVHRSLDKRELSFSQSLSENCWFCNDYFTIRELVLENSGWADLPEKRVADDLKASRLVRLDLEFEPHGNTADIIAVKSPAHLHGKLTAGVLTKLKRYFSQ